MRFLVKITIAIFWHLLLQRGWKCMKVSKMVESNKCFLLMLKTEAHFGYFIVYSQKTEFSCIKKCATFNRQKIRKNEGHMQKSGDGVFIFFPRICRRMTADRIWYVLSFCHMTSDDFNDVFFFLRRRSCSRKNKWSQQKANKLELVT